MKVIIIGSKDWSNYNEVMRQMTVLIDDWVRTNPEDTTMTVIHTGSYGAENMITEYIGKVEKLFKQKGYSIKEKIYKIKNYNGESAFLDRDRDIVQDGADKCIVFIKDSCKRATAFARLASAYDIETTIVRE